MTDEETTRLKLENEELRGENSRLNTYNDELEKKCHDLEDMLREALADLKEQ